MRGRRCLMATILVLVATVRAAADPDPTPAPAEPPRVITFIQTEEPRLICVPGFPVERPCRELPAGRFLDETTWLERETELKRAQTAETRLTAENTHMRKDLDGWQPGWKTALLTFVSGVVGGVYLYSKFD